MPDEMDGIEDEEEVGNCEGSEADTCDRNGEQGKAGEAQ
jgi:hypothetical protein